jgi:hypothetical protein
MKKMFFMPLKTFKGVFLASIMIASLSANTTLAAIDEGFFSGNDILFTDPNGCQITDQNGNIATEGTDVAESVFKFLTSTSFSGLGGKPFNALQAAGALGNFQQESTMNPKAIQTTNGDGHGLAQWSNNSDPNGRRTQLFDFAKDQGQQWSDLTLQLKMIQKEINASYGKSLIKAGFDGVTTPKEASYIFQKIYEGAGTPNQDVRDKAAAAYYTQFKNLAPAAPTTSTPTDGSTSPCSSPGAAGATDFTDDSFAIYNQYDPRWANKPFGTSTTAVAGCGPSSMAMIITALTGMTVTPIETVAYANTQNIYIPGAGSGWNVAPVLAEHWNLKAHNIDATVTAVNEVLRAGGLVITSGSGSKPFTSAGHYIVIRGIADSGNWMIGDSNGQSGIQNSNKEWVPQYILDNARKENVVAITK